MVMEASPSPQSVGREFVRQYYTLLNKAPAHLHRFYNNYSSFVHGGLDAPNRETLPVVGQKQIHNRIQQLNFRDCHAKISQVDSQATLGSGVVVQVTGELSNAGAPMRRFTQTFVLAAQTPKKYYVHNDIFRYQDVEEDGEGGGEAARDADEEGGYFPPPPPAPPTAPFPPAPPAPAAPLHQQRAYDLVLSQLNGHGPSAAAAPPSVAAPATAAAIVSSTLDDDASRHLAAALHATGLTTQAEAEAERERERELEREREREVEREREREAEEAAEEAEEAALSPPPSPPLPPATQPELPPPLPEPKTYANLLKSGGGASVAHAPAARATPATASLASPLATHTQASAAAAAAAAASELPARARPAPRLRADPQPSAQTGPGVPADAGARRYSDSQQLFLGNLPSSATEEELRALLGRFGAIAELRVHAKPGGAASSGAGGAPLPGGRHPNYGFITYEEPQSAQNCLHAGPLYFPAEGPDSCKLNVEEKKARAGRGGGGEGGAARGAARGGRGGGALPSHRPPFPSRAPTYRR